MKEDVLYVYTDASCDSRPDTDTGVIAFSVWDSNDCCLGRYAMVYDGYCDSTSYELIAIREALSHISVNYPRKQVRLITDSDSAMRFIQNSSLTKEPYRSLADEINSFGLLKRINCIKSHTKCRKKHYQRNADVDLLAWNTRQKEFPVKTLVECDNEMEIPRNIRDLEDDTELLKPVDARKLVKRVYVEKQKCENKESRTLVQIKTDIRPGMSALEKFNERFSRFRK